jgi:hypothetical protein
MKIHPPDFFREVQFSNRLHVGWKIAAVFLARVNARRLVAKQAARMLPSLARLVPMKAELGQNACDLPRLLFTELNPHPLSNHLGQGKKARCFIAEQRQQFVSAKRTVRPAANKADWLSISSARMFGSAQESIF